VTASLSSLEGLLDTSQINRLAVSQNHFAIDVELLPQFQWQRTPSLDRRIDRILYEYPLRDWRDITGSRVCLRDFLGAGLDSLTIRMKYLPSAPRHSALDETAYPAPQQHNPSTRHPRARSSTLPPRPAWGSGPKPIHVRKCARTSRLLLPRVRIGERPHY
jgi:hypothetical protein